MKIGDRVRVNIPKEHKWYQTTREMLQGEICTIEKQGDIDPDWRGILPKLRFLVKFDKTIKPPAHDSHQSEINGFWLEATELEPIEHV